MAFVPLFPTNLLDDGRKKEWDDFVGGFPTLPSLPNLGDEFTKWATDFATAHPVTPSVGPGSSRSVAGGATGEFYAPAPNEAAMAEGEEWGQGALAMAQGGLENLQRGEQGWKRYQDTIVKQEILRRNRPIAEGGLQGELGRALQPGYDPLAGLKERAEAARSGLALEAWKAPSFDEGQGIFDPGQRFIQGTNRLETAGVPPGLGRDIAGLALDIGEDPLIVGGVASKWGKLSSAAGRWRLGVDATGAGAGALAAGFTAQQAGKNPLEIAGEAALGGAGGLFGAMTARGLGEGLYSVAKGSRGPRGAPAKLAEDAPLRQGEEPLNVARETPYTGDMDTQMAPVTPEDTPPLWEPMQLPPGGERGIEVPKFPEPPVPPPGVEAMPTLEKPPAGPVWYSEVERLLDTKMGKRAKGEEILRMLKANGAKDTEIENLNLRGFFDNYGDQPIGKQDLLTFVRERAVRLEERVLGGDGTELRAKEEEIAGALRQRNEMKDALQAREPVYGEERVNLDNQLRDLEARLDSLYDDRKLLLRNSAQPKYLWGGLTTEGGTDHIELLFAVEPTDIQAVAKSSGAANKWLATFDQRIDKAKGSLAFAEKQLSKAVERGDTAKIADAKVRQAKARETIASLEAQRPAMLSDATEPTTIGEWDEGHWGKYGRNVNFHFRASLHIGSKGEKIAHADELQAQPVASAIGKDPATGKVRGFQKQPTKEDKAIDAAIKADYVANETAKSQVNRELTDIFAPMYGPPLGDGRASIYTREEATALKASGPVVALNKRLDALYLEGGAIKARKVAYDESINLAGVPNVPFKKNWSDLAVKRFLRWAADNGADRVTWADVDTQVARAGGYDNYTALSWDPQEGRLWGKLKSDKPASAGSREWGKIPGEYKTPEALQRRLGKDLADQLLAVPPAPIAGVAGNALRRRLEGIEWKTGGEGKEALYGKMGERTGLIPNAMRKYGQAEMSWEPINLVEGQRPPAAGGTGNEEAFLQLNNALADRFVVREYIPEGIPRTPADDRRRPVWRTFDTVNSLWRGLPHEERHLADAARLETIAAERRVQGLEFDAGKMQKVPGINLTPERRAEIRAKGFPLYTAPEIGGAVLGGVAGDENTTPEQRLAMAAGGAALGTLARPGQVGAIEGAIKDAGEALGKVRAGFTRWIHASPRGFDAFDPEFSNSGNKYGKGVYAFLKPEAGENYSRNFVKYPSGPDAADYLVQQRRQLEQTENILATETDPAQKVFHQQIKAITLGRIQAMENPSGPSLRPIDVPDNLRLFDADKDYSMAEAKSWLANLTDPEQRRLFSEAAFRFGDKQDPKFYKIRGDDLYDALVRATDYSLQSDKKARAGNKEGANAILQAAGLEGVTYRYQDPAMRGFGPGDKAILIFHSALSKVYNGLSGAQGGQVAPMAALSTGASAALGGATGWVTAPEDSSNQERANRVLIGAGIGAAGLGAGAAGAKLATKAGEAISDFRRPTWSLGVTAQGGDWENLESLGPNVGEEQFPKIAAFLRQSAKEAGLEVKAPIWTIQGGWADPNAQRKVATEISLHAEVKGEQEAVLAWAKSITTPLNQSQVMVAREARGGDALLATIELPTMPLAMTDRLTAALAKYGGGFSLDWLNRPTGDKALLLTSGKPVDEAGRIAFVGQIDDITATMAEVGAKPLKSKIRKGFVDFVDRPEAPAAGGTPNANAANEPLPSGTATPPGPVPDPGAPSGPTGTLPAVVGAGSPGAVPGAGGGIVPSSGTAAPAVNAPRTTDLLGPGVDMSPLPEREGFGGNIRLSKFDEEVRPFIEDWAKTHPDEVQEARRGVQSDAQVEADAKALVEGVGGDWRKLLRQWEPGQAWNAKEVQALRGTLQAKTKEVVEAQKGAAGGSTESLVRLQLALREHAAVQAVLHGVTAEAGRALRAFRQHVMVASEAGDTEKMEKILRWLGGADQAKDVAKALGKLDLDNPDQVAAFIRSASKPVLQDYLTEIFYNSILSGPKTHLVNAISNAVSLVGGMAEAVVAGVIDIPLSRIQGRERSRLLGEGGQMALGASLALPDAARAMLYTIRHGFTPDAASKLEFRPKAFRGTLGRVINAPSTALEAMDQFFGVLNHRSSLYQEAYRTTKGDPQAMAALLLNPTLELLNTAENVAEYRLFKQQTSVATALAALRREMAIGKGTSFRLEPLRFVIPFLNTPVNVMTYGMERSPLGLLNPQLYANLKNKDPKAADQLAKAAMGMVMAGLVAWYAGEGLITGAAPANAAERDRFYREGKLPYALKVGDTWYPYQRLEPLNQTLSQVAAVIDAIKAKDKTADQQATQVAFSIGKNLVSQTYAQGLNDALMAVTEPERYGAQFVERLATGMLVPASSLSRTVTQVVDPVIRKPEGVGESMAANIPGLSKQVPPRLDALGGETRRQGLPINPYNPSKEVDTPLNREMARLGYDIGYTGKSILNVKLTRTTADTYQRLAGQLTEKFIKAATESPRYKAATDSEKVKQLDGLVADAREQARAFVIAQAKRNVSK